MKSMNNQDQGKFNKWNIINVIFTAIYAFLVVSMLYLYYCFIYHQPEFPSDIPGHINAALDTETSGYSLNSFIIRVLVEITGTKMSVAVWIVLLLVGCSVFLAYIAWLFFGKPERKWWPSLLLMGMAPMFMGAIYIPYIYPHHYNGTMAVTSWHNTTVIEMKFFGLITLFLFYWVMKKMKEKKGFYPVWALFVVFLFLTVGFKTNFYISFCPLAGVILLVGFFKSIKEKQWRDTRHYFVTGVSILAVLPVLYYQSNVLFDGTATEGGHQIIISFGTVWLHNAPNVILKPLLSFLPFLAVFIYSIYKKRVTKEWMFLIGLCCIDVLVGLIFAETGEYMYHGNFNWGRHLSLYILNFVSLIQYCQYMREWHNGVKQKTVDRVVLVCLTIILAASLVSGCLYFYKITWGGMSYMI